MPSSLSSSESKTESFLSSSSSLKLSFIVVTYNSEADILNLLTSLSTVLNEKDEVIIIDNASTDTTTEQIQNFKNTHPSNVHIHLHVNKDNKGFGNACNQGAQRAQNDFLIFINPDCYFITQDIKTWIANAFDSKVGVLAPLIQYPNGTIQPNQGGNSNLLTYILQFLKIGTLLRKLNLISVINRLTWLRHFLSLNPSIKGFLSNYQSTEAPNSNKLQRKKCDWVSGAFMVIPKSTFLAVQGFDPHIFLYCEDEDLCRRIRHQGFDIIFDPDLTIIHKVEGSKVKVGFSRGQLERYKSNIYYLKKWNGPISALTLQLFYFLAFFFKMIFFTLLGQFTKTKENKSYLQKLLL